MQEIHVNIQDQTEDFYFRTTEYTASTLRVYLYETLNGVDTPYNLTASNTAKYFYYVDAESDDTVEIDGTVTAGLSYVDFRFNVATTTNAGSFASSINIYNSDDIPEVYANGQTYFNSNPSTRS